MRAGLLIGLVIGGALGFMSCALLSVGREDMEDPGYSSYQDPRLAIPPDEDEQTCDRCRFCYDEPDRCYCVYDFYKAQDYDELSRAILALVEPDDHACKDFKRRF